MRPPRLKSQRQSVVQNDAAAVAASLRLVEAAWRLPAIHLILDGVRFGSLADIPTFLANVRFTPKSGH
jgi:hypothetical protein